MKTTLSPAEVHQSALVIDGHADTPQCFLDEHFSLADPLRGGNFNLDSARAGNLGAQFFAIWVEPTRYKGRYAWRALELIHAVRQQAAKHADRMELVTTAEGITRAHGERKLAALMGIEGGHTIEGSLDLLREFCTLGARYMTLTWNNSNGWADSSGDINDPRVPHTAEGLSDFGRDVIDEMNRLGMMVDLSHVADKTFSCALSASRAPVIASHSAARALCDAPRNLSDEMLCALAGSGGPDSKGGVVLVNFFSAFLSQPYREALKAMQPEIDKTVAAARAQALAAGRAFTYADEGILRRSWMDRIPRPPLAMLIDHIDHIAKVAGVSHVGLGSDFDGVFGQLPEGIDSPADLPKITAALLECGYSLEDCGKILGANLLRVMREVEAVSGELQAQERAGITMRQ
jgi:membrane dipeptidase